MLTREEAVKRLFTPATSRPQAKDRAAIAQALVAQERTASYGEFEQLIATAAHHLKGAGVGKGDRVVLSSENSPELAASIIASWAVGAMAVPVDLRLTTQELSNVVKQLGAKALLGSSNVIADFVNVARGLVGADVYVLDLTSLSPLPEATPIDPSAVDLDAPSLIILTSGTTGMPKGAVHSLGSLLTNLLELGEMAGVTDQMRGVLPLPLSHIFGMEVFTIAFIYGTLVVFSELTPTSFVQCVSRHKPHIIAGVPTLYGALVAAPKEALDLSQAVLMLSGGAPLPVSLANEFEQKFGRRINNGYGSTESKIVALNIDGPIESVGRIVPSVTIDIVSGDDKLLPEGETGEIRISGPILMQGYLNQPDVTGKVLRNGHYYTGDMGYIKDGFLYIAGRTKEMIIVAGYKVFPVEVEDALRKHPLVREVAVLGQAHRQLGQIVKAIIVVNEGELSDKLLDGSDAHKEARQELIAQLKEYCKDNLRRELRPMEWEFQPACRPLPKTASGKIDKKQLEVARV